MCRPLALRGQGLFYVPISCFLTSARSGGRLTPVAVA